MNQQRSRRTLQRPAIILSAHRITILASLSDEEGDNKMRNTESGRFSATCSVATQRMLYAICLLTTMALTVTISTSVAGHAAVVDVPSAAQLLTRAEFEFPAIAESLWAKDDGLPNPADAGFPQEAASFLRNYPVPPADVVEDKLWEIGNIASRQLKCLAYLAGKRQESRQAVAELCVVQAIRLQWRFPVCHGPFSKGDVPFYAVTGGLTLTGGLVYHEAEKGSTLQHVGMQWMRTGMGHFADDRSKPGEKLHDAVAAVVAQSHVPADVEDIHGTDEQFFSQIDLSRPEMSEVAKCVTSGDWNGARKAYVVVLAKRFSPERKWPRMDLEEGSAPQEADDICRNVFLIQAHMYRRYDFGQEVDWSLVIDNDIESRVWMNAHPWTSALLTAYEATGDNKYVTHLCRLLNSWYGASPPTFQRSIAQWRTLEAGGRVGYRWSSILCALANHPTFQRECLFNMARSMLDHGKYLSMYAKSGGNWLQVESSGLATVSLLFPEFKLSPAFYDAAINRLVWVNRKAFLPDGFQSECTMFYHYFPIRHIIRAANLAAFLDQPFPESEMRRLEQGVEVIEYMTYPNGMLPVLSDANPLHVRPVGPLRIGARLFDRSDFRWMVTDGHEGALPKETSYDLPSSGYCVMRTKWGKDAQMLIFDAGYFGDGHQHDDKLNFVFYAGGRELIGDTGIYSYRADAYEPYWRGSWGHNTVVIDGLSQDRRRGPREKTPDPDRRFVRSDGFDFAVGWYRGAYSPRGMRDPHRKDRGKIVRDVQHQRCIFYVKGRYGILCDRVLGHGKHEMEVIFHPSPIVTGTVPYCTARAVRLDARNDGTVVTTEPEAGNFALIPASMNGVTLRDVIGEKDPNRGWFALYGIIPSHDIIYQAKASLPWHFETVVTPLVAGQSEPKKAKSEAVKTADGKPCMALRYGDDLLLLSYDGPTEMICGDVTFHGTALLLSAAGDHRKAFMVDGTFLRVGEEGPLYSGESRPAQTVRW